MSRNVSHTRTHTQLMSRRNYSWLLIYEKGNAFSKCAVQKQLTPSCMLISVHCWALHRDSQQERLPTHWEVEGCPRHYSEFDLHFHLKQFSGGFGVERSAGIVLKGQYLPGWPSRGLCIRSSHCTRGRRVFWRKIHYCGSLLPTRTLFFKNITKVL